MNVSALTLAAQQGNLAAMLKANPGAMALLINPNTTKPLTLGSTLQLSQQLQQAILAAALAGNPNLLAQLGIDGMIVAQAGGGKGSGGTLGSGSGGKSTGGSASGSQLGLVSLGGLSAQISSAQVRYKVLSAKANSDRVESILYHSVHCASAKLPVFGGRTKNYACEQNFWQGAKA
jgi:hypothetical protein